MHTDFVFPYLVCSLDWVTGIAICLLALYFLFRLARVARKTREPFGLMLVRGALVLFGLEIGWNVLMTVGLVPTAGPGFPFISYGGHEVVYMAAVGRVLSVIRRKDIIRVLDEDSNEMLGEFRYLS